MNRRYTGAIADVEQANDQLEQQLRTREAELAESYERLRGIEKRQLIGDERQRLDGVTVTIADNGQGFDVDKALHSGGKGFNNQLRRAQFLGGRVSWRRDNQAGGHDASMTLWLPFKRVQRS